MRATSVRQLACGFVLCVADREAELSAESFNRSLWLERGARVHTSTGRAHVLIGSHGAETWVLRHYHRGGLVARFIEDHYIWAGLERSRAFAEWRLLDTMHSWDLPCPEPIAACTRRRGPLYQCDIITRFLPETRTLSACIRDESVAPEIWTRVGAMVKKFHRHGIAHPDLTAHNILVDTAGKTFLVDFDNAAVNPPGEWRQKGVERLLRSLRKVALETGTDFDTAAWRLLTAAYSKA